MVGMAVATIVPSTAAMKMAIMHAAVIARRRAVNSTVWGGEIADHGLSPGRAPQFGRGTLGSQPHLATHQELGAIDQSIAVIGALPTDARTLHSSS